MKTFLLWLIRVYQTTVSPFRAPCCRFRPTCSAYALEAIETYGVRQGGWLALRRLLKCHPFHRQKSIVFDPVPTVSQIRSYANLRSFGRVPLRREKNRH